MNKPYRVLQVLNSLGRGGIEKFVCDLYATVDRSVIQFDFAIAEGKEIEHIEEVTKLGARVFFYPRLSLRNITKYIVWWYEFFENHKEYIAVHGHVYTSAAIFLKIAKIKGNYTICHCHNTDFNRSNKAKAEKIIRKVLLHLVGTGGFVDFRLACSNDAGKWLYKNREFHVVKNVICLNELHFNNTIREEYRTLLDFGSKTIIGHVGNGTDAKNHLFVIELFENYHKKNKDSILVLIGKLNDKENHIRKFIHEKSLEKDVFILGIRDDVNRLMMAMDIFVFPSLYEGLGIVLIEAQATGLPCVVSDVIPEEALISDIIEKISLDSEKSEWVKKMEELLEKKSNRTSAWTNVNKHGYDIRELAIEMQQFYLSIA